MSAGVAMGKNGYRVVLHLIEVLKDFAIASRFEYCWEIGVGNEHFEDD